MVHYPNFSRVTIIGAGQVVRQRLKPALEQLDREGWLQDVCFCDLATRPPIQLNLNGRAAQRSIPIDGDLSVAGLAGAGALGSGTLAIIATPTPCHVPYAHALAPHVGHVAIEKPIAIDPIGACSLRDIADHVSPIEHQLYKPELLSLYDDSQRGRLRWRELGRVNFEFHETGGVGTRQIDDAIYDLGYHGFACLLAPLRTAVFDVNIQVDDVRSATYQDGPDRPEQNTAAQILGRFCYAARELPFSISVGKGMAQTVKRITLRDHAGRVVRQARLGESGHHAHLRILRELLSGGGRLMRMSLHDSIQVVQACADAVAIAQPQPNYAFGGAPNWIAKETSSRVIARLIHGLEPTGA